MNDPKQVELCRLWIRKFIRPRKTINRSRTSYGLKHDVERWMDNRVYVSNGAFIEAALLEGYSMQPFCNINAFFNMSFSKAYLAEWKAAFGDVVGLQPED